VDTVVTKVVWYDNELANCSVVAVLDTSQSYRIRQVLASFFQCLSAYSCGYMKKGKITLSADNSRALERRSLRRWVKQLFSSRIKSQGCDCIEGIEAILGKLEDIEDTIELIARCIARKAKKVN
jgi:hypothetical protein